MLAYRDCVYDKEAALALAAEDGGSRYIHGILYETGPHRFGIPLDIGALTFVLLDHTDIFGFMAAIEEGADLSGAADEFVLWALERYAAPCAEGDHTARHYLRFALSIARARAERRPIGHDLAAMLGGLTAPPHTTKPQTLPECAFLAAWSVFRLKPGSAGIVAFAALRAEELVSGRDTAARLVMTNKLVALLKDARARQQAL